MNLPVFNCLIDENVNDESGIYAISFVDTPATEVEFVALKKQKMQKQFLCRDSKKQILTGVVLRPDQLIYRSDAKLGEYYIKFSAVEIEKIARKMMKTGVALQNTTHQHQSPLKGNYLTELWIVEDPDSDKSIALGFEPQPKGTLMCSYKIEDTKYWDSEVMTGNVKGFSLEGFFFQESTRIDKQIMNKTNPLKMKKSKNKRAHTLLSKLTHFFLDIQGVQQNDVTESGIAYVVFTLSDGKEVLVDADGFATLDGEQLPAGDHPLSDGNVMVVDENGQFIETNELGKKAKNPDEATAAQTLSKKNKDADDEVEEEDGDADDENEDDETKDTTSESESVDVLKKKIADLESKLSELAGLAQEANVEVQKLRKKTPSVLPATALSRRNSADMTRHERMAHALQQSLRSKRG